MAFQDIPYGQRSGTARISNEGQTPWINKGNVFDNLPKKLNDILRSKGGGKFKQTKKITSGKQGIAKDFFGLGDMTVDNSRNLLNFLGTTAAYLTGNREPAAGANIGDAVLGRAMDYKKPSKKKSASAVAETPEDTTTGPDAFDVRADYLKSQGAENDARLQAMYAQLASNILGLRPQLEDVYGKAAEGYQASNLAATNAVNAGFDVARQQQANMFKTLGIENAAANILARGEDMAGNQTANTSNLAGILSANLNRNTGLQSAGMQNLLNAALAASGEGTRSRMANQNRVSQDLIANLVAQQESGLASEQAAAKLAQDMAIAQMRYGRSSLTPEQMGIMNTEFTNSGTALGLSGKDLTAWIDSQWNAYLKGNS